MNFKSLILPDILAKLGLSSVSISYISVSVFPPAFCVMYHSSCVMRIPLVLAIIVIIFLHGVSRGGIHQVKAWYSPEGYEVFTDL